MNGLYKDKANRIRSLIYVAALMLIAAFQVRGETAVDPELQVEFRYIDLLQQMRMPDMAEEVIAEARKRFPEAAAQFKVREIQGLLWQGRFDDVRQVIDAIQDKNSPEFWALTLAKADAYYAFGRYGEADKLYQEFFKKVEKPSPALVTFYRDSAYKYAQMLLYIGRERDALEAYRRLLKVPLEEEVARQVNADMAELMVKLAQEAGDQKARDALLKEAEAIVDQLLWKQDIWFGKAIVMKAHIMMLRGNVKGAQDLVESYMPQLRIIHDDLIAQDKDGSLGLLRMSPMPQCRYLLAVLLLQEAQAEIKKEKPDEDRIKDLLLGERDPQTRQRRGNGAFNHFINVFIRFPESQWAAEAGERSEVVRRIIRERYDTELRTPVTPEQMARVRQTQFAGARLAFSQNQFKEAAERYLLVLNQFPESPESVAALGDLAICYIELSDKEPDAMLMADTVAAHLSERFSTNEALMRDAGDQLRRIAEHFGQHQKEDKRREVYAMFFRDYPTHHAAGQLIMSFAEREFAARNYVGALVFYRQIIESYAASLHYLDAINRVAQIYREEGDRLREIETLEFFIAEVAKRPRPGHALVVGRFRLADAYREHGISMLRDAVTNATEEAVIEGQTQAATVLTRAVAEFDAVAKMLTDSPDAFAQTDAERASNAQLLEMSLFIKAVCLTQIQQPRDQVATARKSAIDAFEEYIKRYPKSERTPKALLQIGTLHTILGDVPNAQATFERLSREHAGSEEARNAVPMLAASLIEMGLRGEGVAKYREMFAAGGGAYTESQFMAAGRALEEAREFDLALQAYDRVLAMTQEIALVAPARLGRARALIGQKRLADARKFLVEFIADPKLSRLIQVVDANRLLVEVASEEGRTERDDAERTRLFNQAIEALQMVKNHRTEEEERRELDLEAGRVLVRKMEAEKALGLNEKAAETRGQAIVVFQAMIASINPGNAKLANVLERAYYYALPLMLEHRAYQETVEDAEAYLRMFPNGRWTSQVQTWLNQARIGL